MRTIIATRCVLEPLVAAHAQEMFSVLSDPVIYEFENQPPVSETWLAHRFKRLESRRSTDGTQLWLTWIVRLAAGELAGYGAESDEVTMVMKQARQHLAGARRVQTLGRSSMKEYGHHA